MVKVQVSTQIIIHKLFCLGNFFSSKLYPKSKHSLTIKILKINVDFLLVKADNSTVKYKIITF